MNTGFHFADFIPDDALRAQADQTLERILDLAPYGSIAVALLKKEDELFRCSVDVYSKHGPFIAHTMQTTPLGALLHVQAVLLQRLDRWKNERFKYEARREFPLRRRAIAERSP